MAEQQADSSVGVDETGDVTQDKGVADGGSYDIIRQRLIEQGESLERLTRSLNEARGAEFGSTDMTVIARTRVRTENNCVGRDIVQVGEQLLFGYNVFIGLKTQIRIEDVFSLFRLEQQDGQYAMAAVPMAGCFLDDSRFKADFDELYRYYKNARLIQLVRREGKLLAGFQIGDRLDDLRVFRWSVSADEQMLDYIDNRGERDLALPPNHDFEWTETQRDDIVQGRHPHVNILDTLFIETIGGTLTVKIENNTEDGEGIFNEAVDEPTQSLNDASMAYARLGELILVKVLPYKESQWRYLLYNPMTRIVLRIDSIGDSCISLPEDHGIIFPGGYYLASGSHKDFDVDVDGLRFKRRIRSPNGEDVLYVFYEPDRGIFALLSYNLIGKSLQNPILTHGYALASDGKVVVFTADDEPARLHPMQIWQTPYVSEEHASAVELGQGFFSRIGNADLVRGISDLVSIGQMIRSETVSAAHYETLVRATQRLFDDHYWVDDSETNGIGDAVRTVSDTVELIVDEFEKVESIRQHSATVMQKARDEQRTIVQLAETSRPDSVDGFVELLDRIRKQRGHVATIAEYRYIDVDALARMERELVELNETVGEQTAIHLAAADAFERQIGHIDAIENELATHETVSSLAPVLEKLVGIANGLDLLSELIATLKIDDQTVQTSIIERISSVYGRLNATRARGRQVRETMGSAERVEQFAAQFSLFSQNVTNALSLATTPERADEQLTRLLVQLEELEGQFGEHARFLGDILAKREEIHDTFAEHRQQLLDARQMRAQTLIDAVTRMLDSIERRAMRFDELDELNTYLASDALVIKVRDVIAQLHDLGSTVKAEETEARFKMIKDLALRSLRDKSDLFTDGGKVIQLGTHRFGVNTEELDLTLIPRNDGLSLHLVGTRFFEPIEDERLEALRPYWSIAIESESEDVYRAEYLAFQFLRSANAGEGGLGERSLMKSSGEADALDKAVRDFAAPRYREGYQKGVHDHDAVQILKALMPLIEHGDLLRFDPESRALAQMLWMHIESTDISASLLTRARAARQLAEAYASQRAYESVVRELSNHLAHFLDVHPVPVSESVQRRAVQYLAAETGRPKLEFIVSREARRWAEQARQSQHKSLSAKFEAALTELADRPAEQWELGLAWFEALSAEEQSRYLPEAVMQFIAATHLPQRDSDVDVDVIIDNLLGEHPRIVDGSLSLGLDTFNSRLDRHASTVVPAYHDYQALRHQIAAQAGERLRLEEYKARPLSSFVRNRLVNEVYLPLVGDNLAKQIGTTGESRRSDLNGLLMMISPPGYGKTTLMEYIASRLGLTFMKINGPALGHDTVSLDPETAPNATARQELHRLNLALEMGDNVMLYLDDIQHTHPEFLQKFISLCDATRRIEGVWQGRARTYDLRGRKFCVIMAGNPYTESGELFRIPDMLANRADIYNLGDVLSGTARQFELSYIENALSSNPVLAPLTTRDMADVYKLIDLAQGREVHTSELSHGYSAAEISEITRVLQHLLTLRDVVIGVNQQYIASAAQEDRYRTEPRFLLQGSYRNMNKLAEKVSAVMNEVELEALIDDHYQGEAQLLTQGTEANLLKLAELRDRLDDEAAQRWQSIRDEYQRNKAAGGDDADAGKRIALQLTDLVEGVNHLGQAAGQHQTHIAITNTPSEEFQQVLQTLHETIENTLFPLVRSMDRRIALDIDAHAELNRLVDDVERLKRLSGQD